MLRARGWADEIKKSDPQSLIFPLPYVRYDHPRSVIGPAPTCTARAAATPATPVTPVTLHGLEVTDEPGVLHGARLVARCDYGNKPRCSGAVQTTAVW